MTRAYPRLRSHLPVLDRGDGEVQIGLHHGLLLGGVPQLDRVLELLDGRHSPGRIAALTGVERPDLSTLLDRLARAGLLAVPEPSSPTPLVRVLGSGVLARAFAEAYATAGVGDLLLVDPSPPATDLYDPLRPTGADTLRAHLRIRGHERVRCSSHWYRPEGPTPSLTVIAYDRLECDRAITDTLVRADQPHLFLRPASEGVVVGPLVVPGETCCTRCMDLVRTRDKAWPRLLLQLCRLTVRPLPDLVAWAATTTLLQVRAWLAGQRPETWGATIEVREGEWAIEQRHWPHHPDCGCADLLVR